MRFILNKYSYVLLHISVLAIIYILLERFGLIHNYPSNDNIVFWDGGWYLSIKEKGYLFRENVQTNLAFFPLFPFLWKLTGFSPVLISLLNYCFTLAGFIILFESFGIERKTGFVLLSVPSLIFCYIPYSEGLFFLGSALLIRGLYRNSLLWISIGLIFSGLTRSVSIFAILAIIFTEVVSHPLQLYPLRESIKRIGFLSLIALLPILIVALWQWIYTGKWFYFFVAQREWLKEFNWPQLPFTTFTANRLLWLDVTALIFGFIALLFLGYVFFKWLINKSYFNDKKALIYSAFYLAMVSLITIITQFADPETNRTQIYSMNRYIYATPFFTAFAIHLIRNIRQKQILLVLGNTVLFAVLTYNRESLLSANFHMLLNLVLIICYPIAFSLLNLKWKNKDYLFIGIYIFNVFIQVILFNWFINKSWIG